MQWGNTKVESLIKKAILSDHKNQIYVGSPAKKDILIKIGYFVLGIAFCILVWWIVAEVFNTFMMKYIEFPTPAKCFDRLMDLFFNNYRVLGLSIYEHMKYSLLRWVKGFVLAAILGVIIGVTMSLNDRIYRFGMVPVNVLQMIPGLAWYPVCILLFGLGEQCAVFIIAITVISPIAINVCNGLRRVPKVNKRVALMCGKSRTDTFLEVLLPFAAMDFITGFRVGMANAWRMLIAAEMVVGVAVGLGYSIQIETGYLDYGTAFACIIIICAIGLIIDKLFFGTLESVVSKKLGLGESK